MLDRATTSEKIMSGQHEEEQSNSSISLTEINGDDATSSHHVRVNTSFIAGPERRVLLWMAARTPAAISPNSLTVLGVLGAFVVMVGFIGCRFSPWFIAVVVVGLFVNWIGDSLDGTLARYRRIERPDFGYLLDHSCDLISQMVIFVGLGLSPYFTIASALIATSIYFMMTSYTYLKVLVLRTHNLSYYGVGGTELRLMIAVWALVAMSIGSDLIHFRWNGMLVIDLVIGVMGALVFIAFMRKVYTDIRLFRDVLA